MCKLLKHIILLFVFFFIAIKNDLSAREYLFWQQTNEACIMACAYNHNRLEMLKQKHPEAFDKILRDEDRYLFLETLLSARLKFIITYTGMSIQDNSKIPCAGVVSELADTMDQSFIFPEGKANHLFHPLHPFRQ